MLNAQIIGTAIEFIIIEFNFKDIKIIFNFFPIVLFLHFNIFNFIDPLKLHSIKRKISSFILKKKIFCDYVIIRNLNPT